MKLSKLALPLCLMMSVSACSSALDKVLPTSTFTESDAVSKMEGTVRARASLQGADPGALKTVCVAVEADAVADDQYACSTYVKSNMVVLHAVCTESADCTTTGYDRVEEDK